MRNQKKSINLFDKIFVILQLFFTLIIYLIHFFIADKSFSLIECVLTLGLSYLSSVGICLLLSN